jgi:hypothetical protein
MPKQSLDELYQRRDALKKVLRLATLIENLNQCLNSVMGAEATGAELPVYAEVYYDQLSAYFRNISNAKAEILVRDLQPGIRDNLHLILKLTRIAGGSQEGFELPKSSKGLMDFVTTFADRAQLLVGLWVLLFKRGAVLPKLELGADTRSIATRIQLLEERERHYRHRVRESLEQMHEEVSFFLHSADPSDPQVRARLEQMQAELKLSLEHIDNKGKLTDLPIAVEDVNLLEEGPSLAELRTAVPGSMPQLSERPAPLSAEAAQPESTQPNTEAGTAPSFRQKLGLWLNTPLGVSWSDVSKKLKK